MNFLQEYEQHRAMLLKKIEAIHKQLRRELVKAPDERYHYRVKFLRKEIDKKAFTLETINKVFGRFEDTTPRPNPKDSLILKFVKQLQETEMHFLLHGGLGDILCFTPALRALRKKYPAHKIHITVVTQNPDSETESRVELFSKNPNVDYVHRVGDTSVPSAEPIELSLGFLGCDIHYRVPAAEIFAGVLDLELDSNKLDIFLSEWEINSARNSLIMRNIEAPVIAIGTTSRQPANQNWPLERWRQLVETHEQATFIQLGLPDEPLVKGACDFRMTGGLRKSLALLHCCDLYVGMDTFWGHASAALEIPGIVLFGGTHPKVFSHLNQQVLFKNLSCSPCHNKLMSEPCPYGTPCILDTTVAEVSACIANVIR